MAHYDTYSELNDTSLFCLIKQDDKAAFTELYHRHSSVIYLFIYFYIKDKEQTADLLQNVFMAMWENRDKIAINISVKSYLYAAAKNSIITHLRAANVRRRYVENELKEHTLDQLPSAEQLYERDEMNRLLDKAIADLQSQTRQDIIELRRRGLSNKEVAEKLQVPENTVRIYYSQSVRALRDHFKNRFKF